LTGLAITRPDRRALMVAGVSAVLLVGLWGSTSGRPKINLSGREGYEEAQWGYQALAGNRNKEAVRWLRDVVSYQPRSSESWYDLGIAYQQLGDKEKSVNAYRKAADLGNAHAQTLLGRLYAAGGGGLPKDNGQALYWYRKAAAQDDPDALNNVAWEYATSSNPAIRNPVAALEYARKAVDLQKDDPDANHLDTLAVALSLNGQNEEAVKIEQQAIALASPASKEEFQKRLEKLQAALKDGKQHQGSR
jgi:TPR repeat protein